MAKKKQPEFAADLKVTPDQILGAGLEYALSTIGRRDVYLGGEVVIGLYLPALSLRVLFGNNVFALSRMTELSGLSGSSKSAFMAEIIRWHLLAKGGYQIALTEPRDVPDLRRSIVGYEAPEYPVIPCVSVEEWQACCTRRVQMLASSFTQLGSMPWPLAIGVDSIVGVTTQGAIDKIEADGFASADFAREAMLIKTWTQVFTNMIRVWPVSLIGINHLKQQKNKQGILESRTIGGTQLFFSATYRLRLKKLGEYEYADHSARLLSIQHDKNSLSSAGEARSIKVFMRWSYDQSGRQVTYFDWWDATIEMLLSLDGSAHKAVAELLTITDVDKTRRRASCPELGLKKRPYAEIGAAIENNTEMRQALDFLFRVTPRRVFQPDVPYCVQQQAAVDAGDVVYEGRTIANPEDTEAVGDAA